MAPPTAPSAGEEPVLADGLRRVRADVTLTMTLPGVRRTGSGGRALRKNFSGKFSSHEILENFLRISKRALCIRFVTRLSLERRSRQAASKPMASQGHKG